MIHQNTRQSGLARYFPAALPAAVAKAAARAVARIYAVAAQNDVAAPGDARVDVAARDRPDAAPFGAVANPVPRRLRPRRPVRRVVVANLRRHAVVAQRQLQEVAMAKGQARRLKDTSQCGPTTTP